MDHTVVTIYCCGTGEHRDKLSNIVPYTWRATAGSRVWMNDGAGNGKHDILKAEKILKFAERKKTKNVFKKIGRGIKEGARHMVDGDLMTAKNTSWAKGNLGGVGTQDNIIITLQWLWMEYYRQDKPGFRTINLCGWSRGAVTCIMLAHAIESAGFRKLIPNLKVNIFAIDPVPGGMNDFQTGDFDSTGRGGSPHEISPCVNEYYAVLAENVGGAMGPVFRNCSPKFRGSGQSHRKTEFPLPGSHSNVAKIDDGNTVGRLSVSLCHRFLKKHGTEILLPMDMSDGQELEQYARILDQHGKIKTKGVFHKKKVFQKWDVAVMRKSIVKNSERAHSFFVNHHHAALLERLMPRVAAYMAEEGPVIDSDVQKLRNLYPHTYAMLQATGYF